MTRILQAKADFDIEQYEQYRIPVSEKQILKNLKQFETLIENHKLEHEKKFLKKIERKRNSAIRQFARLAEDIDSGVLKKEDIALFAKQENVTWENFLTIVQNKYPDLNIKAFTEDCKQSLIEDEESDPQLMKLLNEYEPSLN